MTVKTVTWALHDAPVNDAQTKLILVAMADNARDNGTGCWLSQASLAKLACCSVRTIRTYLQQLEADGIIRRGDPSIVPAKVQANRRPIVWDLVLSRVRPDEPVIDQDQEAVDNTVGNHVDNPENRAADFAGLGDRAATSHGQTGKFPASDRQPVADKPKTNQEINRRAFRPELSTGGHPLPVAALRDAARGEMCTHGVYASLGRCALCERGERAQEKPRAKAAPRCVHGEPTYRHPDCPASSVRSW